MILGTGAAGFSNYNAFVAQTGWNWTAQLELNVLEFFIAQAGGNVVSLNDSSGNPLFVWGGTGALGLRPFQGFIEPWVAFRGSAWGSSAIGTSLEGGVRFCGNNFGMDIEPQLWTLRPGPLGSG